MDRMLTFSPSTLNFEPSLGNLGRIEETTVTIIQPCKLRL